MNSMDHDPHPQMQKPSYVVPIVAGCSAFVVGIGLTIGYANWQAQQNQIAQMALMLENMQQNSAPQAVTRNAPVDLLSVATPAAVQTTPTPAPAVQTAPEPELEPVLVAAPAPEPTPAPQTAIADESATTADRIRKLVSRSSDPLVSAAIAQDVARRETMSVAIQGVNELVQAATAGNYVISTPEGAENGAVRIRFPGHGEDQEQLERLLSAAAQAGLIAFNDSVKGSDGSFDGRIILFDLVERALLNGTGEERRTGEEIRQKAVSLLARSNAATLAPINDAGERFYTVQAGDSLAYIALQFYGNTNDYTKIFRANGNVLSSPEKIQIGQKLLIPTT